MADDRRLRLAPGVLSHEVDECFVLFDPATQQAVTLNLAASDVLFLCDGEHTVDGLVTALAAHHEQPEQQVRAEVEPLLAQLVGEGVLVEA